MSTLKSLYEAWKDFPPNKPYISPKDKVAIKDYRHNDKKCDEKHICYNFNYLPQPWWGEIENPRIIILVLNPRISKSEKKDDEKYKSNLLNNLKEEGPTINWFKHTDSDSFKWWTEKFSDIIKHSKGKITEQQIYEKVGCFELVAYHSNNSFSKGEYKTNSKMLEKEFGIEKGKTLPTQKAMIDHLEDLLEDEDRLLIINWGQKFWRELLPLDHKHDNHKDYIDYIDIISPQNHRLSLGNLRPFDFHRIIKKLEE